MRSPQKNKHAFHSSSKHIAFESCVFVPSKCEAEHSETFILFFCDHTVPSF